MERDSAVSAAGGGRTPLDALWLRARPILRERGASTVGEALAVFDELAAQPPEAAPLAAEDARRLRADLVLGDLLGTERRRETVAAADPLGGGEERTDDAVASGVADASSGAVSEAKVRERLADLAPGGEAETARLDEDAFLRRRLFPTARAELATLAGLSRNESSRLEDAFPTLIELAAADPVADAAALDVAPDKLARAVAGAGELLGRADVLREERDRARFAEALGAVGASAPARTALAGAGVDSFAAVLADGPKLAARKGVTDALAERLRAHARLSRVSPDIDLNEKLIDKGLDSILAVAEREPDELATELDADPATAARLVELARAGRAHLDLALADMVIEEAADWGGAQAIHGPGGFKLPGGFKFPGRDPVEAGCAGCACRSALGRSAYLADLLTFLRDAFPQQFPDLDAVEARFMRPMKTLSLDCEEGGEVRQIAVAVEVLERFVLARRSGLTRAGLYGEFRTVTGFPEPSALADAFDAYLVELGTSRDEIAAAFEAAAPSAPTPDRTLLDELLDRVHLTETELATLDLDDAQIGIAQVEALPALIEKAFTDGIDTTADPLAVTDLDEARERASAAVDRVQQDSLPRMRANLIHAALRAVAQNPLPGRTIASVAELAQYLCVDLSVDSCALTTPLRSAIEALQAYVLVYRLGREQAQLALPRDDFELRWRWLQGFRSWHAAQMVFCFPETFMVQRTRRARTPQFDELVTDLEADATPAAAAEAAERYAEQVAIGAGVGWPQVGTFRGRMAMAASVGRSHGGKYWTEVRFSTIGEYGDWSMWRNIPFEESELPHGTQLGGFVEHEGRLWLFFPEIGKEFPPDKGTFRMRVYSWGGGTAPPTLETTIQTKYDVVGGYYTEAPRVVAFSTPNHLIGFVHVDQGTTQNSVLLPFGRTGGASWYYGGMPVKRPYPPGVGTGPLPDYVIPTAQRVQPLGWTVSQWGTISTYISMRVSTTAPDGSNVPVPQIVRLEHGSSMNLVVVSREIGLPSDWGPVYGRRRDNKIEVFQHLRDTSQLYVQTYDPGTHALAAGGVTPNIPDPLLGVAVAGDTLFAVSNTQIVECRRDTGTQVPTYLNVKARYYGSVGRGQARPARDAAAMDAYRTEQALRLTWATREDFSWLYLEEYYLHVPLTVAAALAANGHFEEADLWLRHLYDPLPKGADPIVWDGLVDTQPRGYSMRTTAAWLRDPFDPFRIARSRRGAYMRHVLHAYVDVLLERADRDFAQDTDESVSRARQLYELAAEILQAKEAPRDVCAAKWRALEADAARLLTKRERDALLAYLRPLRHADDRLKPSDIERVRTILARSQPIATRLRDIKQLVSDVLARPEERRTLEEVERWNAECRLSQLEWEATIETIWIEIEPLDLGSAAQEAAPYPRLGCGFCVPPNPTFDAQRWRVETNLEKIRTCRNFAGIQRALRPASAAPPGAIAIDGGEPGTAIAVGDEPPPVYRYTYLIERARNLVSIARDIEAAMLSAIEKEESERYSLLRARQDLQLARAGVDLAELRVTESEHSSALAQLQKERVGIQHDYYAWLLRGESVADILEDLGFFYLDWASTQHLFAALFSAVELSPSGIASSAAAWNATQSQSLFTAAGFRRRREEWAHQRDLAAKDLVIADQHIVLAQDGMAISGKERDIAMLEADLAEDAIDFLTERFAGPALYQWMWKALLRSYREHVNQGLTVARMAQQALAFERQETLSIIGTQYWDSERRGLLAAEQLLLDLTKLDQHRLTTERRKQELTKTVSLAAAAPYEFSRLRSEGKMEFLTLLDWFDRDFPRHYLRLIKSVSVTVIALVPPLEGVHATLSNTGVSRAYLAPPYTEPAVILRQPESISITSPRDATGLFETRPEDPLLLPFEGLGVETAWTLELPKAANRFDFGSLMDVLLTIRYTAREDYGYGQRTLQRMGADAQGRVTVESAAVLGGRSRFPDAWYHMKNPVFLPNPADYGYGEGQVEPPYAPRFEIRANDFAANEEAHAISALRVGFTGTPPARVPVEVSFRPFGGATTHSAQIELVDGQGTVPRSAAFPLEQLSPFGAWTLRVRTDADPARFSQLYTGSQQVHGQRKLKLDWAEDFALVIEYSARTSYPV